MGKQISVYRDEHTCTCVHRVIDQLQFFQLFLPGGWREGGADYADLTRISKGLKATEVFS